MTAKVIFWIILSRRKDLS